MNFSLSLDHLRRRAPELGKGWVQFEHTLAATPEEASALKSQLVTSKPGRVAVVTPLIKSFPIRVYSRSFAVNLL